MIKPLLSPRGTISSSPDSEVGIKSDGEKAGGNTMAGGDIVIVQDYENVLKAIDRVVAQIDVQPYSSVDRGGDRQRKTGKGHGVGRELRLARQRPECLGSGGQAGRPSTPRPVSRRPASQCRLTARARDRHRRLRSPTANFSPGHERPEIRASSPTTPPVSLPAATHWFHKALESARPKSWLARESWWSTSNGRKSSSATGWATRPRTQTQTSTVEKVEFMDIGTLLRIAALHLAEGMIRMEIHPERSSGQNGYSTTSRKQQPLR